jgi:hypothetical protein
MLRSLAIVGLAAAAQFFAAALPAAAQGYTTRIEPRPFYGAVVTLEEGVRVIRPLPPDRHVIINPDFKTPLSLGFNETTVNERRIIQNYNYTNSDRSPVVYGRGSIGWGIGGAGGHHRMRHHMRHGFGHGFGHH